MNPNSCLKKTHTAEANKWLDNSSNQVALFWGAGMCEMQTDTQVLGHSQEQVKEFKKVHRNMSTMFHIFCYKEEQGRPACFQMTRKQRHQTFFFNQTKTNFSKSSAFHFCPNMELAGKSLSKMLILLLIISKIKKYNINPETSDQRLGKQQQKCLCVKVFHMQWGEKLRYNLKWPQSICYTLVIVDAVPSDCQQSGLEVWVCNVSLVEAHCMLCWHSVPSQVDGSSHFKLLGGAFTGSVFKFASIDVGDEAVDLYCKHTVPLRDHCHTSGGWEKQRHRCVNLVRGDNFRIYESLTSNECFELSTVEGFNII